MVRMSDPDELTEKEELYAQKRAEGYTKTNAAKVAYPDSTVPRQSGYETELRDRVKNRIAELKEERAEASGLDIDEQVRRYNEMLFEAKQKGNLSIALKIMERLDAIGGFDAPTRTLSAKIDLNKTPEVLKGADLQKDIQRFSSVLLQHTDTTSEEALKIIEGKTVKETVGVATKIAMDTAGVHASEDHNASIEHTTSDLQEEDQ